MSDERDPLTVLASMRASIDAVDHALVNLLLERRALTLALLEYKHQVGLPLVDPAREEHLLAERAAFADARGVPTELALRVFRAILEQSHQDAGTGQAEP